MKITYNEMVEYILQHLDRECYSGYYSWIGPEKVLPSVRAIVETLNKSVICRADTNDDTDDTIKTFLKNVLANPDNEWICKQIKHELIMQKESEMYAIDPNFTSKVVTEVAYLCDGNACEVCGSEIGGMCHHTMDISHAKNFTCISRDTREDGSIVEKYMEEGEDA